MREIQKNNDEFLDIVDREDCVIDRKLRSEVYASKRSNFRVVNAFLINDEGMLWIPRRTKTKRLFPLCLDASMGGHVSSGESYKDAFARELQEELRIDASSVPHEEIGCLNPYKDGTSAFMRVYSLKVNSVPDYNTDDFVEYFWVKPQELLDRIEAGDKCKSDVPIMISALFL